MNFSDAHMSDIVVVVDKRWEDKLEEAVAELTNAGMTVRDADGDKSVVEGVIETQKVNSLQAMDCVDYVRTTFSWVADYPPGDPRDQDGVNRECDDD